MKRLLSLSLVLAAFCISTNIRGTDNNNEWIVVEYPTDFSHLFKTENVTGITAFVAHEATDFRGESYISKDTITNSSAIPTFENEKEKIEYNIEYIIGLQGNRNHTNNITCATKTEALQFLNGLFSILPK